MQPGRSTVALAIALAVTTAPTWTTAETGHADTGDSAPTTAGGREPGVILFLGDSLAAGLGVAREEAFPALIERRIETRGWDWRVVNAGVSGDTTSGGLARLDWLLRQPVDVLVLELGANDGLRGLDPEMTRENLRRMIRRTRERHPDAAVVLAGMRVPPNLGDGYTREFRSIFPELARSEDVHLIPFLLEGVAGRPELNLPDGIHPNPAGHRLVADNVWDVLEPILARRSSAAAQASRAPGLAPEARRSR